MDHVDYFDAIFSLWKNRDFTGYSYLLVFLSDCSGFYFIMIVACEYNILTREINLECF